MRAIYVFVAFLIGAACAYWAGPLIYNNGDAINILITVYTVFAGFLVAIIAVLGDPSAIPAGSWRVAEQNRGNIEARLLRYSHLFALYLFTIAIIFVGVLIKDMPEAIVPTEWKQWIARAYLFFGVTAFVLSLALPKTLMEVQKARVDDEIERRRAATGISDQPRA